MAQEVIVEINKSTGDFTMKLSGFEGTSCTDISKKFDALGTVVVDEPTPEYYDGQKSAVSNCQ